MMGKFLIAAACLALAPVAANATTWSAVCTDGQHIEYDQPLTKVGELIFRTTDDKAILVASMRPFIFGPPTDVVCGVAVSRYKDGQYQVCINSKDQLITFRDPPPSQVDRGTFCKAKVIIK